MKILALESSAAACSAALTGDGALIGQYFQNSGLTHSATLMPMVRDLLKNSGSALEEVDLIAVAHGPGSFTGLRIGVAAAKGLAWASEKPCAGVSTLEAMAMPLVFTGGIICCAMDARRSQVYNALFDASGGTIARLCPDRAVSVEELAAELAETDKQIFIVGDGAELCYNHFMDKELEAVLAPVHLRFQTAYGVALAAETAGPVTPERLNPVYIRPSQAERERIERINRTGGNDNGSACT